MSSPPSPADGLSDLADAWHGEAQAPGGSPSVASSHRSANSQARRVQAALDFEAAARARHLEFLAQEERLKREMDEAMSRADVQSEAGRPVPNPVDGSSKEAEVGVMQRCLLALRHEAETITRLLAHQTGGKGAMGTDRSALRQSSLLPLATFGVKLKVKEPKQWTGKFDVVEREGWIKTAQLYFAGLELDVHATLDEHLTPFPFYTLRSLFSSEAANGTISPQAWFDAQNSRAPFLSVQDVFNAIRLHWTDDHAAEAALLRYRAARQGALRARDFGASLDALADACFDRRIDDLDRRTTFVGGLNTAVQDFVKTQMATLKALGRSDPSFDEVVKIAATTDGLAGFAAPKKTPSHSPSTSGKKTSNDPISSSGKSASPSSRTPSTWTQDAQQWQSQHPVASKTDWFDARARVPNLPVRCYNCGVVGDHFSRACPSSRKDPKGVVIAMLSKLSISSPSPSSSDKPTGSSATITKIPDGDSGKADGE